MKFWFFKGSEATGAPKATREHTAQPTPKPTLTFEDRVRRASERLEQERRVQEEAAIRRAEAEARAEEARREAMEEQLAESIARNRIWLPLSSGDVWSILHAPRGWPRSWRW